MPAGEHEFWEQVVQRWIGQPGLLIVVVPEDINQFEIGRQLRNMACRRPASMLNDETVVPDAKDTYCYDARRADELTNYLGAKVLPFVLAEGGRLETARQAARGEIPLFLMISGLSMSDGGSLDEWIRSVIEGWPGPRQTLRTGRLHCCCLVTTPPPRRQSLLPEGCERLVASDVRDEEIAAICADPITEYWRAEGEVACRYVESCAVDMASGRRPHAELAVAEMMIDWQRRSDRRADWFPGWRTDSEAVLRARQILEHEGITTPWLDVPPNNTGGQASIADRLWAWGLWRRGPGPGDVNQGLTTLARVAMSTLEPLESTSISAQSLSTDAAMFIFRQTVQVEHLLKDWLRRQLQSAPSRDRIRAVLDAPCSAKPDQVLRDYIAEQIPEWQIRIPADQTRLDHVAISICSFGVLKGIMLDLLPTKQRGQVQASLNVLVSARNLAAHGGWFTLKEYQLACDHIDRIMVALPSLRI